MLSRKKTKLKISHAAGCFLNYEILNGKFFFWCGLENPITVDKLGGYCPFTSCRESLAYYVNVYKHPLKYLGFKCDIKPKNLLKRINSFFNKYEKLLKIKERTIFYPQPKGKENFLIMKVSPWWSENTTRASLFSLFLRLAAVYYLENNLDKAIEKYDLANRTKLAIKYFLAGNTVPTYKNIGKGWYEKFAFKNIFNIKEMLVK